MENDSQMMSAQEFDVFYANTYSRLVGQLYAMTGDYAEAQDVVQEAFAKAWDRLASFSAGDSPEAWVRTVAWRLAVSRFRRAKRALELLGSNYVERQVAEPTPERAALVAALRTLPERQRRAIVLHYLCDLSVDQVAAETGSPAGTVKVWLARGRAALARQLSGEERNDD